MLITHQHARVYDGVTRARMMALTEPEELCRCGKNPAAALWVHAPSGKVSPLCVEHRDEWLTGDGSEDTEPPVLVPLRISRSRK